MNTENMRIAVVGLGGVGGYLGGMLAQHYPQVTFAARGARGEALKKDGFTLHSDYKGEIHVSPEVCETRELTPQDIIFLSVKNYSLEAVCGEMKNAVTEDTVIVPVMNGADPGERVRKYLGKGHVVDSLIYIVAFANPDFSVSQQGKFASLRIGVKNAGPADEAAVALTGEVLKGADIDFKASKDIEADIWKKYILNCAYNVTTACYNYNVGQLRADEEKAKQYETLAWEAARVAMAKGVRVTEEVAESVCYRFRHELADNATSSMQRDVVAGKMTELETFSGYVVREADRLGVDAPVSHEMYEKLKKIAKY